MVKTKEFKGTINVPNIDEPLNKFVKELSAEQLIDIKFNTNLANIKKKDGTTDLIVISTALLVYEE